MSMLTQETISYLKLSYKGLAHKMSIPEMVLRDAVECNMGLTSRTVGQVWSSARSATTYERRPDERDGTPCWEICFRPSTSPWTNSSGGQ